MSDSYLIGGIDIDTSPAETPPLVDRVEVVGLHGRVDYDLDLKTRSEDGALALFYGDNGSGKTTILRLLWDFLSPAQSRGHRTRIAEVAFSRFSIHLTDGVELRAVRKLPTDGPYEIEYHEDGQHLGTTTWPDKSPYDDFIASLPESELRLHRNSGDPEILRSIEQVAEKRRYWGKLEAYGSPPFFLSDNRTASSDEVDEDAIYPEASTNTRRPGRRDDSRVFSNPVAIELGRAFRQVNARLRQLTLGASVQGSAGANSVYSQVVRQLAYTPALETDPSQTRSDLMRQVEASGQRNLQFSTLDLVPPFDTDEFIASIEKVDESNLSSVHAIIRPFLQSLDARLDALDDARSLIQTLLDEGNRYLTDKVLTYRGRTLRIELIDRTILKPEQLSSGECHILLLIFNAVLATGTSRLFMIDEPELSLNVKWQRRIVKTLTSLATGTGLQFILATHSIELLSGHRARVVRLIPKKTHA